MSHKPQPMTVEQMIGRLRGVMGHVGKKDRQVIADAIGGIMELSQRLYAATHAQANPTPPQPLERMGIMIGPRVPPITEQRAAEGLKTDGEATPEG